MWRPMLSLLLGAVVSTASLAGEIDSDRAQSLNDLVRQDCGSCHGMTLRGGLGRPLLPANLAGIADRDIAEVILDGIPGTPMPPWRGLLNEAEALWIARALKEGEIR